MSEPSFLLDTTPRRNDTRWMRWMKILGVYQSSSTALPTNNPKRDDTLRVIKMKILNALTNTP